MTGCEVQRVDHPRDLALPVAPGGRALILPEVSTVAVLFGNFVRDEQGVLADTLGVLIDSLDQVREDD